MRSENSLRASLFRWQFREKTSWFILVSIFPFGNAANKKLPFLDFSPHDDPQARPFGTHSCFFFALSSRTLPYFSGKFFFLSFCHRYSAIHSGYWKFFHKRGNFHEDRDPFLLYVKNCHAAKWLVRGKRTSECAKNLRNFISERQNVVSSKWYETRQYFFYPRNSSAPIAIVGRKYFRLLN